MAREQLPDGGLPAAQGELLAVVGHLFATAAGDRRRVRVPGLAGALSARLVFVASALGFCCRTGSAAAVAVGVDGRFAGRWAVDLAAPGTPVQLFHAAAGRPDADGFVRAGAAAVDAVAGERLDAILGALDGPPAVAVIVGEHPVPDGMPVARIVAVHALMHGAEGQLYRDALLDAAAARGLVAHGVPRRSAEQRLVGDLADAVARIGAAAGRPWRREQKLATVAALVAVPTGEA